MLGFHIRQNDWLRNTLAILSAGGTHVDALRPLFISLACLRELEELGSYSEEHFEEWQGHVREG